MRLFIISFCLMLLFSACKKSELELIPSNEPPTDKTISSVTLENYITRTYILALGREPNPTEFNQSFTNLTNAKADSTSRRVFLNQVFSSSDFRPHTYEENKINLLNNIDTADFSDWINLFSYLLQS